ncbi:urokinase plasminogen activator surface receptor-like [Clarias gariepinus]|uniref:urokinase plasminogen activator surface receptor-like n=1 Tax=Clarias gariepinus TaxID=13013 RepID=UPI00234D58B9|nr:urokinase plasminogen activator surface receptor-like [Clarias gariepinus]
MLNCLHCASESGSCTTTTSQQCPSDNVCAALIYNFSLSRFIVNIGEIHGCLPQAVCNPHKTNPSILETIYSANVGVAKGFLSIFCCESNNCNRISDNKEQDNKPNGLQCLSCWNPPDKTCNSSISCAGNQDHCITGTVINLANLTVKGCASKSFCGANFHNSSLGNVQCCTGNLCNSSETRNRQGFGLFLMIIITTKLLQ